MKETSRPDATELGAQLRSGERSVVETVQACLAAIDSRDGELRAFAHLERERALARAASLDESRRSGAPLGPLFGVPVALKSNLCWEGAVTDCGSRILAGYRAPYTATCVQRLLDAGAVPLGTTHMDEFAMGSSGENSAYACSKNPWDPTRTAGGSSSGSAVAVAAGFVPLALGSDTGGSVRQPASHTGTVGFKPTYGRVSRYGLVAFGSSLDQVSPLASSVRDIELTLEVLAGPDPLDATSSPGRFERERDFSLEGVRIGRPREYFPEDLDGEIRARIESGLQGLVELGAEIVELSLPHTEVAIPTYYVVATAEASSNLARFDGVRYGQRTPGDGSLVGMYRATRQAGFGDEVKRRILLGTYVLSSGYYDAWYGRASKVRELLRRDFDRAFEEVDLVCGPTSASAAFPLGEKADDPVSMYLSDLLTVPASLAGLPAVSLPAGLVNGGGSALPVGLQLTGPRGEDARVLAAARLLEESLPLPGSPPHGEVRP